MTTYYTEQEILTQTEAWEQALEVIGAAETDLRSLLAGGYDQVLFTGCGSTYYLSLAAATLFQQLTGRTARAIPAGELLLNPGTVLNGNRTLLVAISRSGATTETLVAVERFRAQRRGEALVISNYADQPLAGLGDLSLILPAGQEISLAQTRSFASMYVAACAFSALAAERDDVRAALEKLPLVGRRLIERCQPLAQELGQDPGLERFYFLGSGALYGLACEASLKMKEMSLTHSEPFRFFEFRHGPMAMVNAQTLVVGLLSEVNQAHEAQVMKEMGELGGRLLTLGESGALVSFESGLAEAARGVLYLPMLQLLAFYRARSRGLNPDQPANLNMVVKLDMQA